MFRIKSEIERLLTWNEDEELQKGLKIVILKGLFTKEEVAKEESKEKFFKELEEDIRAECAQKVGDIERLVVYDVKFLCTFIESSGRSCANQV